MSAVDSDLIAAVSTGAGRGGVGVVRLSGDGAQSVAQALGANKLVPHRAHHRTLHHKGELIDAGLVLLFPDGRSFTGQETVEFQIHGSPVALQLLLAACCELGARVARPGEFTERAFLNGNMDLAQAEAVIDLIEAGSVGAARGAARSLQGEFSRRVQQLVDNLEHLRVLVEACIDFPEEDVELMQTHQIRLQTDQLRSAADSLLTQTRSGQRLNEGIRVAFAGLPNVGKSSLLNRLTGEDVAIVTDVPGTTRDSLTADIEIKGVPVRLVDTAGIRHTDDQVEQLGIKRSITQVDQADVVVYVVDGSDWTQAQAAEQLAKRYGQTRKLVEALAEQVPDVGTEESLGAKGSSEPTELIVVNKADLWQNTFSLPHALEAKKIIPVSALQGTGIDLFKAALGEGLQQEALEAPFTARARHVEALTNAMGCFDAAIVALDSQQPVEFVAEELRSAGLELGLIIGTSSPDELLGKIFSEFCIGK